MNTLSYIYEKVNRAKALDFGTIFSQSIDLFKKSWLQGFILQLFVIILTLPFIMIFYIPLLGIIVSESQNGYVDPDVYSTFFAGLSFIYIFLFIAGILVISAVSLCLYAAFYRILRELDYGREITTNDFFHFLKGKYLSKAFILVLITTILYFIVTLLVIPTFFISLLGVFYLIVPLSLLAPIFGFNPEFSVSDIVSASFKLGNKKWLLLFGLIIISSILASIVGFLLCGIGSLFTAAFVYHPTYFVYKEVIGFETGDELSTLGQPME